MNRIGLFGLILAGVVLPLSLSTVGLSMDVHGAGRISRTANAGDKMRISPEITPLDRYRKLASSTENNTVERVVILTLDAFRPTYINKINSPTFDWIIEQGTSADYAITVNPTVTAAAHVSIACGATAGTTGIIGNTFYDWDENETYSLFADSGIVHELVDLIKVPPAFILAENASTPAAAIGWPYSGGEWTDGTSLSKYISYSYLSGLGYHASNVETARLTANTIVENPELKLIYSRLPGTDYAAHYNSESSAAVIEQIQTCEEGLKTYFEILQDANLLNNTVTIILSDHGMMSVSNSQFFLTDQDYFKDAVNKTGLTPLIARDAAYDLLYFLDTTNVTAVEEFASYLTGQAEIEAVFTNEEQQSIGMYSPVRSANISVFFKPGISSNFGRTFTGMHGYLNSHSEMRTLFMMVGPSIAPNKTLTIPPSVLDATPTAFQLLGLSMAPHFEGTVLNEAIGARGAELQFPRILEITPAPNSIISVSSLNITAKVPSSYGVPTIEAQISSSAGFSLIKNMSYDAESQKYWVECTDLADAVYEVILKPYSEAMPFSRIFSFEIDAIDDPPSLAIAFPVNGTTTTKDSIMVIIEATDDRGAVASVEAQVGNGSWVPLPSIGASDYSATLTGLLPGQNIIKIRANDTGGNVAQITLEILADLPSPTLTTDTTPDTSSEISEASKASEGTPASIFMTLLALGALGTLLLRKRLK
ncbi:MAG: alkaline phosphatase family protein [Candidatus Hodarchaeales archaeon]|jgi:ectonucleotide pyrophosphatase/phosphodiesterase family protein 5